MLLCARSSAPLVREMERSPGLVVLFCPNYDFLLRCTVLHAPPRGHALRACVVSRRGNIAHGRMKGDLDPESDVHTSGSVHSPLAYARASVGFRFFPSPLHPCATTS